MNPIKKVAAMVAMVLALGGLGVAVSPAAPAQAAPNMWIKNEDRFGLRQTILVRAPGSSNKNILYRTNIAPGQTAELDWGPRQIWIPTGCAMRRGGSDFGDAWGREGYWKNVSWAPKSGFSVVDCRRW